MPRTGFFGRLFAPRDAAYWLDRARRCKDPDTSPVSEYLTEAIRVDPTCVEAYLWRGRRSCASLYKGHVLPDYARALVDFDQAIQLDPERAESYRARAYAYKNLERIAEARADLDRALALAEEGTAEKAALLEERADIHRNMRNFGAAIADLTEAIRLEPKKVSLQLQLGRMREYGGDFEGAIIEYTNIQSDERWYEKYLYRGWVFLKLNEFGKAIEDFTEVIRLNPYGGYYAERAKAYFKLGDVDAAMADLTHASPYDRKQVLKEANRLDLL